MTTYLPDTNILINASNGRRGHRELLRTLLTKGHRLACCSITVSELFSGVHPKDLATIEEFVSVLKWLDTTPSMARQAGRWRYDYSRQGLTLSLPDTLIAATALGHGLTLITDNRKHFPMPELSLYRLAEDTTNGNET